MFYHASKISGITVLKPRISNHGKPLVYLSTKRENVLVYLSNAIEKHCKHIGFSHNGVYKKWASYGFTKDGVLRLEEYYPSATIDTYRGESGYIYYVEHVENCLNQSDIPCAVISENEVPVVYCEYIPDAYEAIQVAIKKGEIIHQKYANNSHAMSAWIERTIKQEYQDSEQHPDYREFLKAKFDFLKV